MFPRKNNEWELESATFDETLLTDSLLSEVQNDNVVANWSLASER